MSIYPIMNLIALPVCREVIRLRVNCTTGKGKMARPKGSMLSMPDDSYCGSREYTCEATFVLSEHECTVGRHFL